MTVAASRIGTSSSAKTEPMHPLGPLQTYDRPLEPRQQIKRNRHAPDRERRGQDHRVRPERRERPDDRGRHQMTDDQDGQISWTVVSPVMRAKFLIADRASVAHLEVGFHHWPLATARTAPLPAAPHRGAHQPLRRVINGRGNRVVLNRIALLIELAVDRIRGTGYYRSNDAVNSLSAGTLSTTFGYFTKLVPAAIWAWVLADFGLFDLSMADFDLSPAGLFNWFLALLAFDFCYYWAHRMGHEISVLWAAHAVHHQSEDYNLSTALRQTSTGFLFGWIFYLPLFLLGMPFEVFVTVNAIDLIYQFWVHTQHIRKLGWMEKVFVTPSNHRVHHAQNEAYIDKNYGGILIIWDRIFGTFQEELDDDPVVFGVRKPLQSWNPFWANVQVYDYLLFDARHTRSWKDKLGVWFRRTGWRPADVEAEYPKSRANISEFRKYDPQSSVLARRYVIGQFVIAAFAVLWIGQTYATDGVGAVVVPCLLLWAALYSFGVINEGRAGAVRFELARLLLLMPAGFYWIQTQAGTQLPLSAWLALAVYSVASALVCLRIRAKKNVIEQAYEGRS